MPKFYPNKNLVQILNIHNWNKYNIYIFIVYVYLIYILYVLFLYNLFKIYIILKIVHILHIFTVTWHLFSLRFFSKNFLKIELNLCSFFDFFLKNSTDNISRTFFYFEKKFWYWRNKSCLFLLFHLKEEIISLFEMLSSIS